MTVKERIDWIALPIPRKFDSTSGKLRISVLARPVLTYEKGDTGKKNLERFPTFINWPNTIKKPSNSHNESLTFTIEFTDYDGDLLKSFNNQQPLYTDGKPDPQLWSSIFKPDTPVRPVEPEDFNVKFDNGIRSYPVSEISSYIDKLYNEIAIQISNDIQTSRDSLGFMEKPSAVSSTVQAYQGKWCKVDLKGDYVYSSSTYLTFRVLDEEINENIGEFKYGDDNEKTQYSYTCYFKPYFGSGYYTLRYVAKTDFGSESDVAEIIINVDPINSNSNNVRNSDEKINSNDKGQQRFEANKPSLTELVINRYNKDQLQNRADYFLLGSDNKVIHQVIDNDKEPTVKDKFYFLRSYYELLSNIPSSSLENKKQMSDSLDDDDKEFDFHDFIEWLNEYEVIFRKIGMIFDFEIEYDPKILHRGKVRIQPDNGLIDLPSLKCWTRYKIIQSDENHLRLIIDSDDKPNDNKSEHNENCMLVLDQNYNITTKDVADSASKLINLANNIADLPEDDSNEQRLNTMISNGFSLVENQRSSRLKQHFEYLSSHNYNFFANQDSVTFTTKDLIKGHRIDVWDSSTTKWHSLCFRNGTYKIKDGETIKKIDEGFISVGVSTPTTNTQDNLTSEDLPAHVNEALFNWKGWSLSVPPIGKTIGICHKPTDPNEQTDPISCMPIENPSNLSVTFEPIIDNDHKEKKLPKLRFGRSYRFRARSVDIAGNSLDLNETISDTYAFPTQDILYLRYEPIGEPIIISKVEINQPGEAIDTLVIRSDFDKTVEEYSTWNGFSYPTYSERFLAPPKVSQDMAEVHGMFDDLEWYKNDFPPIDGILKNFHNDPSIYDDSEYKKGYNVLVNKEKGTAQYDARNNILRLDYLPDPLAHGIVFQMLSDNTPKLFEFKGKWPGIYSIKVRVEDVSSNSMNTFPINSSSLNDHETIIMKLNKGDVIETMISCFIFTKKDDGNTRSLLAIYNLLDKTSGEFLRFNKLIDDGKNWLVAPARKIRFIHAVEKPLKEPKFDELTILRPDQPDEETKMGKEEATIVICTGKISLCGKTTSKLEVIAEWKDIIEDIETGIIKIPKFASVGEILLEESNTDIVSFSNIIQLFNDTKHRKVTYSIVATSRFQKYFTNGVFTRTSSEKITRGILNTGIPDSLKIADPPMPSFRWEEIPNQNYLKRHSGCLRIYLEGPWFLSGEEELLGVVIPNDSDNDHKQKILEDFSNYVTIWGNDVVYLSNSVPNPSSNISSPLSKHFKNYKVKEDNIRLNDSSAALISVIGYEVFYDSFKHHWYSDIEIDSNPSYFPFIRLSVVRYQPNSISGCQISEVENSVPVQLLPSRSVSLVRQEKTNSVTLSTYGEMYISDSNHYVEIKLEGLPLHSNNVWIPLEEPENKFGPLPPTICDFSKKIFGPLPTTCEFSLDNYYNCNRFRFQLMEYELIKRVQDSEEIAERLVYAGIIYLYDKETK